MVSTYIATVNKFFPGFFCSFTLLNIFLSMNKSKRKAKQGGWDIDIDNLIQGLDDPSYIPSHQTCFFWINDSTFLFCEISFVTEAMFWSVTDHYSNERLSREGRVRFLQSYVKDLQHTSSVNVRCLNLFCCKWLNIFFCEISFVAATTSLRFIFAVTCFLD